MEDHRYDSTAVPVVLIPTMGRPVILDAFLNLRTSRVLTFFVRIVMSAS
jgi:hypothetical protein